MQTPGGSESTRASAANGRPRARRIGGRQRRTSRTRKRIVRVSRVSGSVSRVKPEPFVGSREAIFERRRALGKLMKSRNTELESLGGGESSQGVPPFFSKPNRKRLRDIDLLRSCGSEGCGYCRRARAEPPKKRIKLNDHGVAVLAVVSAAAPRPARRKFPSLRELAMRRVLVHYRRPSQFERRLPMHVADQVWRHLPLKFLSDQRVARTFATGCGCISDVHIHIARVQRHVVTMCARCLGLDPSPDLPPCSYCKGRFARCGCDYMPYTRMYTDFDEEGNMTMMRLAVNRNDWGIMGISYLVGQGYLHGRVSWKRPYTVMGAMPGPPTLHFHCGIRVRSAYDHDIGGGHTARLCRTTMDIKGIPRDPKTIAAIAAAAGDGLEGDDVNTSAPSVAFVLERPLERLPISVAVRERGAKLFAILDRHAGRSRTVAVYREVAKIYMETLLRERQHLARAHISQHMPMPIFVPSYRLNLGHNLPDDSVSTPKPLAPPP